MKRGIILDGALDTHMAYNWYRDMNEYLDQVGLGCNYIGVWCDSFKGEHIRTRKRCEKRYTELMKADNVIIDIDLYHIHEPFNSHGDIRLECVYRRCPSSFVDNDFIYLAYDEGLIDECGILQFIRLSEKYMNWIKRTDFSINGTKDSPSSFVYLRNEEAYETLRIDQVLERPSDGTTV